MTEPARASARRAGWGLLAFSLLATWFVMLAGPSAAEPPLPGSAPLLRAQLGLPAWLVWLVLVLAVLAGAAALWLGVSGRWRPGTRRLLAVGLLATAAYAVTPPIGSADPLSYAAYGRMAGTGHDPWSTAPRQLARAGDPVARAVEPPWQDTPSVYGPLAAGEQDVAARVGGTDVAATVELLDVIGAAALAFAALAVWLATGRRQVVTLLLANPLVLIAAVAGAHVDTLVAAFTLAAVAVGLAAVRRATPLLPLTAGVLSGLAADVKITGLLATAGIAAGLVWSRRRGRDPALVVAGTAVVLVPSYLAAGSPALHQLRRASHLVSAGTPWRPVVDLLQLGLPRGAARTLVGIGVVVLLLLLAVALVRLLRGDDRDAPAVGAAALLIGYVLAAAYALAWYDAVAWAALCLAVTGRKTQDRVVVLVLAAHTTLLTLAYLPGRAAVPLHGGVKVATDVLRAGVSPAGIALLIAGLLAVSYHLRVRDATSGRVKARRILPAIHPGRTPRQERGTQRRP